MSAAQTYDFQTASRLSGDKLQPLSSLHRGFAQKFAEEFAAFLGVEFELGLKAAEQLPYRSFLEELPEAAYVVPLPMEPRGMAVLYIETTVLLPVMDLLLGGMGKPCGEGRELTELEDHVIMGAVKSFAGHLQSAWQGTGLAIQAGKRSGQAQLQRLLPASETVLRLTFAAKIPESESTFQLVLSAGCVATLIHKLAEDNAPVAPAVATLGPNQRLRDRLLECKFGVELGLKRGKVLASELLDLHPGKIIRLGVAVQEVAALTIGGRDVFSALPVRSGSRRAAHIGGRIQPGQDSRTK